LTYRKVFRLYELCRTEEAVLARTAIARGRLSTPVGRQVSAGIRRRGRGMRALSWYPSLARFDPVDSVFVVQSSTLSGCQSQGTPCRNSQRAKRLGRK
jgi:hypothetical protein